jgi:hypothetical protein
MKRLCLALVLEGFRPRRIVRFNPANSKVDALPREEQFFGRESCYDIQYFSS